MTASKPIPKKTHPVNTTPHQVLTPDPKGMPPGTGSPPDKTMPDMGKGKAKKGKC